ncbi:DNA helicase MCM8, putative [Plasmodium knowlesi strain H]|uniref:DNA helicase n=3 Tax=Plasmodium knowlesi TaxID=5850 RepID=A0A5E7X5B7_PLAKH|nr:DNA helicase MCM8, putative [Plasmodium knowlesi strain H]OTN66722.1 putative DNA helicase MCM8 [Plasmodium knowlesi]CAA9990152.1 DNA helicase MCM8, putative [Plasmodium knowlesi strain H]SBO25842.1 DNA helicase MCM8, putative [Plasmodium knowlesi strain H]SBO28625.1 DNA helicase MCM8, putative [Plasmodium knowlesi strain H]VVS79626.1 DNA helicase MCM8, putative [Plasmodium knowlesi strain H]
MDTLVHLYFNQSELNEEVKTLILSWVSFFKNNWNSLFNVDKEVVLNLEFFLDNKKLMSRNPPPNNEVYLHELKKNPEIVLKFMKLALHLLLCKILQIEEMLQAGASLERSKPSMVEPVEKGDLCTTRGDKACNMKRDEPIDGISKNLKCGDQVGKGGYSKRHGNVGILSAASSMRSSFISRDEISEFENDDPLIRELKCDRYKDSEFFKAYFLTNRITIYIYNWNKLNKFEDLKSEKVNQLISLRGSILRVSPIQLLITRLYFMCEKCKGIIQIEFTDGKYDTPKSCPKENCEGSYFQPIRESAKSVEYQKIILKENRKMLNSMNEMGDSNVKNLTVTLEVSKFFINSCVPGNYVEVVGILKVISYNNSYFINGKNSIYNMYLDCLSIFPLSSRKYLENSSFNFEKIKDTKNKLYNSFLWESYVDKIEKKMLLYGWDSKYANADNMNEEKEGNSMGRSQSTHIQRKPTCRQKPSSIGNIPDGTHLRTLIHTGKNATPTFTQGYRPIGGGNYDATSEIDIKAKTNISFDGSTVNNSMEMNTYEALICEGIGEMLSEDITTTSGDSQKDISGHRESLEKTLTFHGVERKIGTEPPSGGGSNRDTSSMLRNLHLDDDELYMYGDYIDEETLGIQRKRKSGQGDYGVEGEMDELGWPTNPRGMNQVCQGIQPGESTQSGKPTNPTDQNNRKGDHHVNRTKQFDENVLEFIKDMHKYGRNKFYLLVASLCPRIIMSSYIKAGILLSLLGGKTIYDEHKQIKRRGSIHNLLIGDPGLGKSRILQYVSNIIENSLFICSTSTSINGLTACAFKDPTNNEYSLEGGALVLSDKGICCIDELDKISLTDQQSFLECMESQCINISKAGIVCNLKTRCSIIAASNPKEGKYNYNKTVFENIKIPFPLLSRFDLVFLLTDKMSEEKDYQISNYLINSTYDAQGEKKKKKRRKETEGNPWGVQEKGVHERGVHEEGVHERGVQEEGAHNEDQLGDHNSDGSDNINCNDEDIFSIKNDLLNKCRQINERSYLPVELLGVFIKYCRKCIFPTLSDQAKKYIRKFYLHLRSLSATQNHISSPITIRQLESLIRLCQARARGDLSNVVTLYHAKEVVEIYQKTIFYPSYVKTLNFKEKPIGKKKKGKSVASISNVFKEGIIQLVKNGENKIFNKDLRNLAKSVILSAESYISDEAIIHYLNNEGFILYKGGYWQVDPFYLQ